MNTISKFISVCLITVFVVISAAAQCTEADNMSLEKMDKAWGDAIQERDKATLDGMLSKHYVAFNLATATDRKAAMAVADTPLPKPNSNVSISDHYIIRCSANTAVMTHRNEFQDIEGGKGEVFYSRSVHVFSKEGGKWSVLASVNHPMDEAGNLVYMTYSGLEAFKKKDVAWFEAHTHDDAVSIDPTGKISGRTEMIDGIKNDSGSVGSIEILNISASVSGESGVVIVMYDVEGKAPDGTPITGKYQISRNFVREKGKWMMRSAHATKMPDAP